MWMVKTPETFDTMVPSSLCGDIVTDLAAMLQGGLGVAAGANLHPGKLSMFEPIHGSAPKYRGRNKANPLATMGSCALLLDAIGEEEAARTIEGAIESLLRTRKIPSLSAKDGPGTKETGDLVLQAMESRGPHPVSLPPSSTAPREACWSSSRSWCP